MADVPVGIVFYESPLESAVLEFADQMAHDGVEVEVRSLGPQTVYASLDWVIPTMVAVVVVPLSAGFFQAAGEDAYRGFKQAVAQLAAQVLGRAALIRAGESNTRATEYSPALSIIVPLPEGWRLKILLRDSYDASQLDAVLDRLFEQLTRLESGELTNLFDTSALPPYMRPTILARYDEDLDALLVVDPVEEMRRKS